MGIGRRLGIFLFFHLLVVLCAVAAPGVSDSLGVQGVGMRRGDLFIVGRDSLERRDSAVGALGELQVGDSLVLRDSTMGTFGELQVGDSLVLRDSAVGAFGELQAGDSLVRRDSVAQYSANVLLRLGVGDTVDRVMEWRVAPGVWAYRRLAVDSALAGSHYVHVGEPGRGTVQQMGIHYTPQLANDYFARVRMGRSMPFWMLAQSAHLALPRRVYHTLGPFARFLGVSNGSSTAADLAGGLLYTQNVTPYLNVGFDVLHGSERSVYRRLEASVSKGQGFFSVSKGRWYVAAWGGGGRHVLLHNGGIADDRLQTDTVLRVGEVPVRLDDAMSIMRVQEYSVDLGFDVLQRHREEADTLGRVHSLYREPELTVISQHSYVHYSRLYTQTLPRALPGVEEKGYNRSRVATRDSVAFSLYEGRMGLAYHGAESLWGLSEAKAWVEYSTREYVAPSRQLYLMPWRERSRSHTMTAGGSFGGHWRELKAEVGGWLAFAGNERGASRLEVRGEYPFRMLWGGLRLGAEGSLSVEPAQVFVRRYYSNEDAWESSDLAPERELRLRVWLDVPRIGGSYGARAAFYTHYTYFDTIARPAQSSGLNVVSVYARHSLVYRGFLLEAEGAYQISSLYGVLSLPRILAYAQFGYEYGWSRGTLRLRLALEAHYYGAFQADLYRDALGVYHQQRGVRVGGYPMVGVLLAMKWKNANVFFHLSHANEGLMGRKYFSGVHYPERERTVRFGFQWYLY